MTVPSKSPRIILWDIETTNLSANIGHILCVGWKVFGEKKVGLVKITDYDSFKTDPTDDYEVVKKAGEILSTADAYVTWYGTRFDLPFLQSRLLYHGLPPLPPMTGSTHIDGWRIARYKLKLNSNRLNTVSMFLGLDDKTPIKWRTWERASAGHTPSLNYIYRHCKQDIIVLEQAYEKIKVLEPQHFNVNIISGKKDACPTCGVEGNFRAGGWNLASVSRSKRYQCLSCGRWCSGPREGIRGIKKR